MGHDDTFHLNAQQTSSLTVYVGDQAMGVQGERTLEYQATCAMREGNLSDQLPEAGLWSRPWATADRAHRHRHR